VGLTSSLVQPDPEDGNSVCGERCAALLASLAEASDVCPLVETDIPAAEPGELGDPQASLDGGHQESVITATDPAGPIGSTEQSVDLVPIEE
jgi:hypothetical protein